MAIQWELRTLSRSRTNNGFDCSIYSNPKEKNMNVSMKMDFWRKMGAPDSVACGIDTDTGRVYFREDNKGYRVGRSGSKTRCYFKIPFIHPEFVGDYPVRFDRGLQLFYVDKKDKRSNNL